MRLAHIAGLGAGALVLLAAAWMLRPRGARGLEPGDGRDTPTVTPIAPEPAAAAVDGDGDATRSLPGDPAPRPKTPTPPEAPPERRVTLRGSVVSALTGEGLAGLVVELTSGRGGARASATTDSRGAFDSVLAGEGWRLGDACGAIVRDAGVKRFEGLVRLEQDLQLAVGEVVTLRGRIECDFDAGGQAIAVAAYTLGRRTERGPRYFARTVAGSDGALAPDEFLLAAAFDTPVERVQLRISVGAQAQHVVEVPFDELASPAGALIRLVLGSLRLLVLDENGLPIEGARARAGALDGEAAEFVVEARSDAQGLANLELPAAEIELCVGAAGREFRLEHLDLRASDLDVTVTLPLLDDDDRLVGRVMVDDGSLVTDALVTASPDAFLDEVTPAAFVQVRVDEAGRFELAIAGNAPIVLHAYSRSLDAFVEQPAGPSRVEQVLRLRLDGTLAIEVETGALPGPFRAGPLEYVLVEQATREVLHGIEWRLPLEIPEVPRGIWDVFVLLPGLAGQAESAAPVEPGRTTQLALVAQRASWIEGRVHDAAGAPLSGFELVAYTRWPREACEILGWERTDRDGHFRVFASDPRAELALREAGTEFLRRSVRAGELVELALP